MDQLKDWAMSNVQDYVKLDIIVHLDLQIQLQMIVEV